MAVYLGHFPSGTSLRTLEHYGQLNVSGKFQYYDYNFQSQNKADNWEKYHQESPPEIDLTKISRVPIAMYIGKGDLLATVDDCNWARTQLKTLV